MIEYKGYFANPIYDPEANVIHGEVLGIRDVVTFEADSASDLRKAFEDSVDDYIAFCRERGEEPEKAFSGKFQLRLAKELHRQVSILAALENISLNAFVVDTLSKAVSEAMEEARRVNAGSYLVAAGTSRAQKAKARVEACSR